MRFLFSILVACLTLHADGGLSISLIGVTNTSAAIRINGATGGDCTLELSESNTYAPLVADVDNSKYSGANTCAGRPDTKSSGSDLLVWLGHKVSDRVLATDTQYYLRVRSGTGTATLTFKTETIGIGQQYPWPVPVDRRKWANRGFGITPTSLATKSAQVDPVTGVKMWPIGGMNDITNREGPFSFAHWSDGTGWTNPSRIIDATTSGAQTSNTNPITLYIGPESDPHNWLYSATGWNDLGIIVYACGDDANAANRTFTISFSNNFSAGIKGTPITVSSAGRCSSPPTPLPQVLSTSTDTDKPWPSAFPSAPFAGWGNDVLIGWDDRPTTVTGTVSSDVFAATGVDARHHVSPLLEVGNKVALTGCTEGSGLCTVSAIGGTAGVTVSGTASNGAATATILRSGIQIKKTTATGNLWVSVKYKIAEAYLLNTTGGALQTVCNTNSGTITTGDGHVGYLCMISGYTSGMAFMYFVSPDGTSRMVWHGGKPWPDTYFTSTLGWDSADVPSAMNLFQAGQLQPDPADPRGWYLYLNNAAPYEVYRLHYSGTVPVIDTGYGYDLNGAQPLHPLHTPSDYFDWYRVTPSSTGSLASQLANFSYYPLSAFGPGFTFYGASGHSLYFENILGGQDHAGWVAVGDISSGSMVLTNVFSSYDGQGAQGRFHHASIHNVSPRPYPADTVVVSLNALPYQSPDPSHPYDGEWQMPVVAVDRGTVGSPSWSANTALPWPIDNTYLNTCPSNTWGYTGNRCVHFKVAKGGFCNTTPNTTIETTACPASPVIPGWNVSGYRQSLTTRPGDMFVDKTTVIAGGQACYHGDCENFKIITSLVDEGDGFTSFWAARDAAYDYCTMLGLNPQNSTAYQTHNSGWIARATPMGNRGCSGGALVVQGKTESTSSIFEIPRTLLGHTDIVKGSCSGCTGFVSASSGNDAATLDDLFDLTKVKSYASPTWHGSGTNIGGGVQAYAVSPGGTSWFTDANTINGNVGGPGELNNAGTGTTSTITNTSCADVYLITITGTTDYKNIPLRGVAGSYPLQEVSSPTVDLCSASVPAFTLAYAYKNGEAMSGTISGAGTSQAGQTFIKVPAAQAKNLGRTDCNVTQHWANTPCVIGGNWVGGGFYRQRDYLQNDSGGVRSRWLTSGLEVPLAHYPYSAMIPLDSNMAWTAWSLAADWGMTPWITKLPRYVDDSATSPARNDYIATPVTVSTVAGATKARVRFGRNKDFYCVGSEAIAADGSLDWSGRSEACVTDAGSGPFRFAGETQTLQGCVSGCVVNVPLVAQTINYAQVEHLDDSGAIVQTDPVQILIAGKVSGPPTAVSGSISITGGGKIQ